jgi:Trk K+ transport system NAD-binding subunit
VYRGNALDPAILAEAEIRKADGMIVALGNDESTRGLVRLAKFQFGVPKVIAVTKDSASNERIMKLGAEKVVCAEDIVLKEIKVILHRRGHRVLFQDSDKDYKIEQLTVRATSGMLGKRISSLPNKLARVAGVIRSGTLMFPKDEIELQMGDEVIVIGTEDGVEDVSAHIGA